MRKYILILLFSLASINLIANNEKCHNYWNPLIESATKELSYWFQISRITWNSTEPNAYQDEKDMALAKCSQIQEGIRNLQDAKKYCLDYGLEESISYFDRINGIINW